MLDQKEDETIHEYLYRLSQLFNGLTKEMTLPSPDEFAGMIDTIENDEGKVLSEEMVTYFNTLSELGICVSQLRPYRIRQTNWEMRSPIFKKISSLLVALAGLIEKE